MSELSGIFARGVLLGYAKTVDKYQDSNGQKQEKQVHMIGIEREIKGNFGELRKTTLALIIPNDKMNDNEFMSDIRNYIGHVIEVSLSGYTDYSKSRRPFIANEAKIISLSAGVDNLVSQIADKKVSGLGI